MLNWYKIAKKYQIHDNGGRPFICDIKGKTIQILKAIRADQYSYKIKNNEIVYQPFKKINIQKAFVGKDDKLGKKFDGNSILAKIKNNNYLACVGFQIFQFQAPEQIINYYSQVGNNDVPYPVAESENYLYFMLDKMYVSKYRFPDDELQWDKQGAYMQFYGHMNPKIRQKDKIKMKYKIIFKSR